MKKIIAVILALICILTISACGENTEEEKIAGSWKAEISFSALIETLEGGEIDFFDNIEEKITITLDFDKGKYTLKTDPQKAAENPEFQKGMKLYMLDMLGMTENDIMDSYGTDADTLAIQRAKELTEALTINETMEYSFKDGKLYLENEVHEYRFNGEKLILTLADFGELEFSRN